MGGRPHWGREQLGLGLISAQPAGATMPLAPAPRAMGREVLATLEWILHATTWVAQHARPGGQRRRAGTALPHPSVARSAAPGIFPHRIYVFPCCLRWCLELADAVCWGLVVEGVRSDPHDRVGALGSFSVVYVYVQELPLLYPWAVFATSFSVFPPAEFHPGPLGHASVALPNARAVARLADSSLSVATRPSPGTRTLVEYWAATTSPAREAAPTGSEGIAEATRRHRAPRADTTVDGFPP